MANKKLSREQWIEIYELFIETWGANPRDFSLDRLLSSVKNRINQFPASPKDPPHIKDITEQGW